MPQQCAGNAQRAAGVRTERGGDGAARHSRRRARRRAAGDVIQAPRILDAPARRVEAGRLVGEFGHVGEADAIGAGCVEAIQEIAVADDAEIDRFGEPAARPVRRRSGACPWRRRAGRPSATGRRQRTRRLDLRRTHSATRFERRRAARLAARRVAASALARARLPSSEDPSRECGASVRNVILSGCGTMSWTSNQHNLVRGPFEVDRTCRKCACDAAGALCRVYFLGTPLTSGVRHRA